MDMKLYSPKGTRMSARSCALPKSPLVSACRSDDLDQVQAILENAIESAEKEYKALGIACLKGNLGIVQLLIDSGADVNKRTIGGRIPLGIATEMQNIRLVNLLLGAGADPNKSDLVIRKGKECRMKPIEIAEILENSALIEILKTGVFPTPLPKKTTLKKVFLTF